MSSKVRILACPPCSAELIAGIIGCGHAVGRYFGVGARWRSVCVSGVIVKRAVVSAEFTGGHCQMYDSALSTQDYKGRARR